MASDKHAPRHNGKREPAPNPLARCGHACTVYGATGQSCGKPCPKPRGHPGSHTCADHRHTEGS